MTTLLLLIAVVAGPVLLVALFLWAGLALAHVKRRGFPWVLLTLGLVLAGWWAGLQGVLQFEQLELEFPWHLLPYLVLGMAAVVWLWLVSRLVLRATTSQVIFGWLATVPACVLILLVLNHVVRPRVLEIQYLRSNSMAPTLLALHHTGTCPHCGGAAFVPYKTNLEFETPDNRFGMCRDCLRMGHIGDTGRAICRSDRFVVNKLLEPQRWDLIFYRDPARKVRFAKRVVGLPGEEVVIQDGGIRINGEPIELPPNLQGLEFAQKQFDGTPIRWGTADSPAKLGSDEFFVLDDFSVHGNDSRMWLAQTEGRPPYALPRAQIEGVVALICWPEDRLRILR
jgi:signal peptidase I